jgi:hypothetical protein
MSSAVRGILIVLDVVPNAVLVRVLKVWPILTHSDALRVGLFLILADAGLGHPADPSPPCARFTGAMALLSGLHHRALFYFGSSSR